MAEAVVTLNQAEVKQAITEYLQKLGWKVAVTDVEMAVSTGQRDEQYVVARARLGGPSNLSKG